MPIPTSSTQLAAKQAILTLLQSSTDLKTALITWGVPNWEYTKNESIAVTDIDNTRQWANLGRLEREEDYAIKVEFAVRRDGKAASNTVAQEAETRLNAMIDDLELMLLGRSEPGVLGPGPDYRLNDLVTWAYVSHRSSVCVPAGQGYVATGEVLVSCQARI